NRIAPTTSGRRDFCKALRILVVRLYPMTTPPACRQATGCNSVGYQDSACKFLLEMVTTWSRAQLHRRSKTLDRQAHAGSGSSQTVLPNCMALPEETAGCRVHRS